MRERQTVWKEKRFTCSYGTSHKMSLLMRSLGSLRIDVSNGKDIVNATDDFSARLLT